MGPNGSGKSTLANALMGHPSYKVSGRIVFEDDNIIGDKPDERSKKGLFLSFQYPVEIPGVTVSNFLRTALNSGKEKKDQIKMIEFIKLLHEKMDMLHIPREFASRYLNEGFSGGEKKKMEILQLAILNPKLAILDETDSGLDIDALKNVCESINTIKKENPELTLCIMLEGQITKIGGPELAEELEKQGYEIHNDKRI